MIAPLALTLGILTAVGAADVKATWTLPGDWISADGSPDASVVALGLEGLVRLDSAGHVRAECSLPFEDCCEPRVRVLRSDSGATAAILFQPAWGTEIALYSLDCKLLWKHGVPHITDLSVTQLDETPADEIVMAGNDDRQIGPEREPKRAVIVSDAAGNELLRVGLPGANVGVVGFLDGPEDDIEIVAGPGGLRRLGPDGAMKGRILEEVSDANWVNGTHNGPELIVVNRRSRGSEETLEGWTREGRRQWRVKHGRTTFRPRASMAKSGEYVATYDGEDAVIVVNVRTGHVVRKMTAGAQLKDISWAAWRGKDVVILTTEKALSAWEMGGQEAQ